MKVQSEYPILAREGRVHLAVALGAGVAASFLFGAASIPAWLLAAFVLQFFRDPRRTITSQPGAIVAPASGKIMSVGAAPNPYGGGRTDMKISIFMDVFSVHSNLIPVGGRIEKREYFPGRFLNAALDKSSSENERSAITIHTDGGQSVVCVQIAGLIARRILNYAAEGERVKTGQRYGFIRFGSRVDLYVPEQSRLNVKLGQRVASGNDTVAYLPGY